MFGKRKHNSRLRELGGSDFRISEGQPDIRGWDVRDAQGRKFGVVHELIFDVRAQKVRYMVIRVFDVKELELEKRTVLVPIGFAELDMHDDDVIVPDVTPYQLRALPRYDRDKLGAKIEHDISTVFGREFASRNADEDVDESFYEHEHFNEGNLYRRRRNRRDRQRLEREDKVMREEEMEIPVNLHPDAPEDVLYDMEGNIVEESDEDFFRRTGKKRRRR